MPTDHNQLENGFAEPNQFFTRSSSTTASSFHSQILQSMELKPGLSALVTGGASGIGRALSLALAEKGVFVTIVDFSEDSGNEVVELIKQKSSKLHQNLLELPAALFIRCDVTVSSDLAAAFRKHFEAYGGLDICINCAGIGNPVPFHKDQTDGSKTWRRVVNVNLVAVIECTRLAIRTIQAAKKRGVIINLGSSSGLYPMYAGPIYSASKGAVVLFTRSLAPYKHQGIRINVLCPEFVKTDMASKMGDKLIEAFGGYVPMDMVIKGAFELITDESVAGSCLWITNRRGLEYWPSAAEKAKYLIRTSRLTKRSYVKSNLVIEVPQYYRKIVVQTLSHNFRNATRIVHSPLKLPIKSDHVLLKIIYAGVNASDVNFSSGRYFGGDNQDVRSRLPFDAGFEAVGIIAAVGNSVNLEVGTPAAVMTFGGYTEFTLVNSKHILPVPKPDPEVVALLTSGLTASIALEEAGQMESGKVVMVTAASGGTGQFAVQLAKMAGNKVVATCGGKDKAMLLKDLGVDQVIDYRAEDIKSVLKKEFPKGLDLVYESVGGEMLNLCLNALAVYGKLIVIGMISQYQGESGWQPSNYTGLLDKLLTKSQTVTGFFLVQYGHLWQQHLDRLYDLFSTGKLKVLIDPKRFLGVESVPDAVEYLHSGKSMGKVVVCMDPSFAQPVAKL